MSDVNSQCNTKHTKDKYNANSIQIVQINKTKQRMFRVDVEVLERWSEFCKAYQHIKVQNLISTA